MIVGTGIDIAEVPRIAQALARHGDRFLHRVFTEGEIRYCDSKANRVERYAARFAAKEAGMKALGTGWSHGVRWRDIEVSRQPEAGPPSPSTARRPSLPRGWARFMSRFRSHTLPSRRLRR